MAHQLSKCALARTRLHDRINGFGQVGDGFEVEARDAAREAALSSDREAARVASGSGRRLPQMGGYSREQSKAVRDAAVRKKKFWERRNPLGRRAGKNRKPRLPITRMPSGDPMQVGVRMAPWHRTTPDFYRTCFRKAQALAPHLEGVAHSIFAMMPRAIRASCNLRTMSSSTWSSLYDLSDALTQPWIQINNNKGCHALLFDIDHQDGQELVEALPPSIRPHLVVDPFTLRSHAILVLNTPVVTENGRAGPRKMLYLLHGLMAAYLNATALHHTALVKNPWGLVSRMDAAPSRWGTVIDTRKPGWKKVRGTKLYMPEMGRDGAPLLYDAHHHSKGNGLGGRGLMWHTVEGASAIEMSEALTWLQEEGYTLPKSRPARKPRHRRVNILDDLKGAPGRNCAVFNAARLYAYDNCGHAEYDLAGYVDMLNADLPIPMDERELRAIIASIERFMASRWNGRRICGGKDIDRGVMELEDSGLKLPVRQHLSAVRTNVIRREATEERIRKAIAAAGSTFTQAELASSAGISIRNLRRYWGWALAQAAELLRTKLKERLKKALSDSHDSRVERRVVHAAKRCISGSSLVSRPWWIGSPEGWDGRPAVWDGLRTPDSLAFKARLAGQIGFNREATGLA